MNSIQASCLNCGRMLHVDVLRAAELLYDDYEADFLDLERHIRNRLCSDADDQAIFDAAVSTWLEEIAGGDYVAAVRHRVRECGQPTKETMQP